jgi:CP family cyanate transporter-like MFS transporter
VGSDATSQAASDQDAGIAQLLSLLGIGFILRAVLLGVPPVLEQLRRSLGLSNGTAGLVIGVPVLVLGLSALPGAAVTRRIGAARTVAAGLGLLAIGAVVRAAPGGFTTVMIGTLLLATGIGAAQPPLARLAQVWFPQHVQRAATVMTLGLLVGGITGATATPIVVHAVAHDWRGSFVFWSVPAAAAVVMWLGIAARSTDSGVLQVRLRMRALLADSRVRWITLLFAAQGVTFYTANTWIAGASPGGADTPAAALNLLSLNGAALPTTLILIATRRSFSDSRPFYVAAGLLSIAGTAGWTFLGPQLGPLWSLLLGGGGSMALVGTTAYAPMSFPPAQVAGVAATVWTVGYIAAFVGPPLAGVSIDLFHNSRAPFALCLVFSLLLILGGLKLPRIVRRAVPAEDAAAEG